MSGEMAEKAAAAAAKPVTFLAGYGGGIWNRKAVVELAERQREVGSPLEVAALPTVPEARREILVSKGCVVHEAESLYSPKNKVHLAMADDDVANFSKLPIWGEFGDGEHERLVYVKPVMNTTSGVEVRQPPPRFNGDTFMLEPSIIEALRRSPTPVVHHQQQSFLNMLEEKLAPSMLANKDSKFLLAEKKLPPFSSWLATTNKEVIFARKNLPAMAALAASSAAAGVITTAANPAICFGFYAIFIAAIAFVTISLREI